MACTGTGIKASILVTRYTNETDYLNACKAEGYDFNNPDCFKEVYKEWNKKNSTRNSSQTSTSFSSTGDIFSPFRSSAQFGNLQSETTDLNGILNTLKDALTAPNGGLSIFTNPSDVARGFLSAISDQSVKQLELYYSEQSALRTAINKDAGLNFEFADAYRKTLTDTNPKLLQYGISFQQLANTAGDLIVKTGRFYTLNEETWEMAGKIGAAYLSNIEELADLLPAFEKIGVGATNAMKDIEQAGRSSVSLGLRAQSVTKELTSNIGKLNEYGFQSGVAGLTRMIQKSNEFRMSMNEVFKIADKVMSPEGAIELSANLQVLGGAIGDFNDPLKLMYMATNNVEGLQDSLIKAAGNLATYNTEQKRFEITGVNLRYAREMASQLGVSYQELANGAIATAEKSAAASAMMRAGLVVGDEEKEFITNIAKMKDGQMVIDLSGSKELQEFFGGTSVALEDLSQSQIEQLKKYRDDISKKTPEDVINNQYTSITRIENMLGMIVARMRTIGGRAIGDITDDALREAAKAMGVELKKGDAISDVVTKLSTKLNKYDDEQLKKIDPKGDIYKMIKDWINGASNILNVPNKPTTTGASTTPTIPTSGTPTTPTTQNEQPGFFGRTMSSLSDGMSKFIDELKNMGGSILNVFGENKTSNIHLNEISKDIKTFLNLNASLGPQNSKTSGNLATLEPIMVKNNNYEILNTSLTKLDGSLSSLSDKLSKDNKLTVEHTHKHEHLVKSPAIMDTFARYLYKNPTLFDEMTTIEQNSYLSPEMRTTG